MSAPVEQPATVPLSVKVYARIGMALHKCGLPWAHAERFVGAAFWWHTQVAWSLRQADDCLAAIPRAWRDAAAMVQPESLKERAAFAIACALGGAQSLAELPGIIWANFCAERRAYLERLSACAGETQAAPAGEHIAGEPGAHSIHAGVSDVACCGLGLASAPPADFSHAAAMEQFLRGDFDHLLPSGEPEDTNPHLEPSLSGKNDCSPSRDSAKGDRADNQTGVLPPVNDL